MTLARHRFVALDLAVDWIELERGRRWTLAHTQRKHELLLSAFPVAAGVTIDLATLRVLARERQRAHEAWTVQWRGFRRFLLDEWSWERESTFCLATRARISMRVPPEASVTGQEMAWTVSNGHFVLEATIYFETEDALRSSGDDCEAMMRTVRFEGPS